MYLNYGVQAVNSLQHDNDDSLLLTSRLSDNEEDLICCFVADVCASPGSAVHVRLSVGAAVAFNCTH